VLLGGGFCSFCGDFRGNLVVFGVFWVFLGVFCLFCVYFANFWVFFWGNCWCLGLV